MIWSKKIKGGALQLVLFVGAIVVVLLLSFILMAHSHKLFEQKTDILVELIQETDKGLSYSFEKGMDAGELIRVPSENDHGIETTVEKDYWGLLERRTVKAKKGKFQFEKTAFVGPALNNRPALYLKDNQYPLVLAGNTRITGTAFLPERGVKMGNIYGNSYHALKLIYGKEERSTEQLPVFLKEFRERLMQVKNESKNGNSVRFKRGLILKNSFAAQTQIIQGDYLRLEECTLTGNMLVRASHEIVVDASAKLNDVLLIAPKILVKDSTRGSFQALAETTISVGKGCELDYPSVLAVTSQIEYHSSKTNMNPNISMGPDTKFKGFVVYWGENNRDRFKPHIHIDENAKIYGEVFSSQNVELKGSVYGNVTASGFVALENGSVYQNHIYNGIIDAQMLHERYAGIPYSDLSTNQVMKWLY